MSHGFPGLRIAQLARIASTVVDIGFTEDDPGCESVASDRLRSMSERLQCIEGHSEMRGTGREILMGQLLGTHFECDEPAKLLLEDAGIIIGAPEENLWTSLSRRRGESASRSLRQAPHPAAIPRGGPPSRDALEPAPRRTTALRVVSQFRQKPASGLNGWTRAANLGESPTLQVRDDRGKLRPALGTIASASALHSP
jgi:hypothetical protein